MKVAVTGATGFVGRHVVAELERRSLSPTLICRPGSVVPPAFAKHTVVRFDVQAAPANAFDAMGQPETLIHLAWGGLPNYRSPHHVESELPAQYAFLERLVESGLRNCIVTGTCLEYGMQSGMLCEECEARPTNPYGMAKDALRRQLESLRQRSPFNLTWARVFYLYGEGQSASSILPQLGQAVLRGDRQFAMSGGEQMRDYLPVETAAKHLVSLAMPPRDHGIVNVCSGTPISVRRLVEDWIERNGWSIALDLGKYPYPDYEPMAFWGNDQKLRSIVG